MYLGQIVENPARPTSSGAPRHRYTAALLSVRAVIDPARRQSRIVLRGEIRSPINSPSGCRFHTRCPVVRKRCRTDVPPLVHDDRGLLRCHFPLVVPVHERPFFQTLRASFACSTLFLCGACWREACASPQRGLVCGYAGVGHRPATRRRAAGAWPDNRLI
ncbi:hypothetical protein FJ958_18850 [Mesorhizobium sp. B2-3-5]|nr:hypothetical protein FJ958_18850 [Mesorhizobium sp. B2-3-5]